MIIDVKLVKEQYPKGYAKLSEFGRKYLQEFQNKRLEEIRKEHPEVTADAVSEEMGEQAATAILTISPRQLYDFFSENGIEICIDYVDTDKEKNKQQFMYKIYTQPTIIMSYYGRTQTELEAFKRGFSVLEPQLQ